MLNHVYIIKVVNVTSLILWGFYQLCILINNMQRKIKMNGLLIKKVFSNEAFRQQILEIESSEEMLSVINDTGLLFNIDDVVGLRKMIEEINNDNGYLTLETLNNVASGLVITLSANAISAGCFFAKNVAFTAPRN